MTSPRRPARPACRRSGFQMAIDADADLTARLSSSVLCVSARCMPARRNALCAAVADPTARSLSFSVSGAVRLKHGRWETRVKAFEGPPGAGNPAGPDHSVWVQMYGTGFPMGIPSHLPKRVQPTPGTSVTTGSGVGRCLSCCAPGTGSPATVSTGSSSYSTSWRMTPTAATRRPWRGQGARR